MTQPILSERYTGQLITECIWELAPYFNNFRTEFGVSDIKCEIRKMNDKYQMHFKAYDEY